MSTDLAKPSEAASEAFFSRAIERVSRFILVLGLVAVIPLWFRFGFPFTGGFVFGALLSWTNFRWLSSAVNGLADRIVDRNSRERGGGIVLKFVIRYVLIGLAAYVIFVSCPGALVGLLVGLCLPVGAMICEAAYEAYAAFARGL